MSQFTLLPLSINTNLFDAVREHPEPEVIAKFILPKDYSTNEFYDVINGLAYNRNWKDTSDDLFRAVFYLHGVDNNIIVPFDDDEDVMKRLCRYDAVLSRYSEIVSIGADELVDFAHGRSFSEMFKVLSCDCSNIAELAVYCDPCEVNDLINERKYDWEVLFELINNTSFPEHMKKMYKDLATQV